MIICQEKKVAYEGNKSPDQPVHVRDHCQRRKTPDTPKWLNETVCV